MSTFIKLLFILILFQITAVTHPAYALKKRIPPSAPAAPRNPARHANKISYSTAKLDRPARSVHVTFQNLESVTRIDYILNYSSNGLEQGAGGSIESSSGTETRSLYFGTCSHGVCTPHWNITNAQILVTAHLKNGGSYVKRYRVRM